MVGLWMNRAQLFDFFHQIVALIARTPINDARFETVFGYTRPLGEQFATTISTLTVDGYVIPSVLIKRLSVTHTQNFYLLTIWLCHINHVIDARCSIKIEGEILET